MTAPAIELPYGTVGCPPGRITITATHDQLYAWAHRPGSAWPCSYLARRDSIAVVLNAGNGDLVDLDGQLPSDELTAWLDDCLHAAGLGALARYPAIASRVSR
jgi:hypothetical protein